MRGREQQQEGMFSYLSPESRVPTDHPLRAIRVYADEALRRMSRVFSQMYSERGRDSVPPETLLKSTLLMALYSVRSERLFCEMLDYNLLFRWFLGMSIDDASFDHSTFSKNRARLLSHKVAPRFLGVIVRMARRKNLVSDEHFTVDGTLIDAWASMKSFKKKDGSSDGGDRSQSNPSVDFHGEQRSNETHASTTDPEARLARKGKGKESRLAFMGHALMENRNGLVADVEVLQAHGTAERDAALVMMESIPVNQSVTVGADKGYDTKDFVSEARNLNVTPQIAQNNNGRRSAIDGRTTRHAGYLISQRKRKRVEEIFGWMKTVGGMRKLRHRGLHLVGWMFTFAAAAYNLVRIRNLATAIAGANA